jgi:hypothetical protein
MTSDPGIDVNQHYLDLSEATRFVSSPMIVPRAESPDWFTGTPRSAPIRA